MHPPSEDAWRDSKPRHGLKNTHESSYQASHFAGAGQDPQKKYKQTSAREQSGSPAQEYPSISTGPGFFKCLAPKDNKTEQPMEELRRLHNKCKRNLILEWVTPGSHVLDCGCGRGGDIHKWNSIPQLKITAVDPDEASLTEAQNRAIESKVGIWFLPPGDIQTASKWGPYDVVCYNFSLHYIFETPEIYTSSVLAISRSVKTGGYLIGITPDKTRVLSVLNSKTKFVDRLGNSIELRGDRLMVNLTGGPFYADGGREEPILDPNVLIDSLQSRGFKMLMWKPMLQTPNGLVSDIYSQFVFVKQY